MHILINLRPAGGCLNTPPPPYGFSQIAWKRRRAGRFHLPYPHLLATFVKVSILGHARSGHQVRSSDHTLQKLYNRATASVWGKAMKLSEYDRVIGTYKIYISDFYISDLPIISRWAKIKLPALQFILSFYEWNRTM